MGITRRTSSEMPILNLFGSDLRRTFRDAVHAVGNHGELYERTIGLYIPRSDRNILNTLEKPGPLLYVLPGFEEMVKKEA